MYWPIPYIMTPLSLLIASLAVVFTNAHEVTRFALSNDSVEPEVLPPAQFSVALGAKAPRSSYKGNMRSAVLKKAKASNYTDYTGILAGGGGDEEYLTDTMIGGQTFQVIVDSTCS